MWALQLSASISCQRDENARNCSWYQSIGTVKKSVLKAFQIFRIDIFDNTTSRNPTTYYFHPLCVDGLKPQISSLSVPHSLGKSVTVFFFFYCLTKKMQCSSFQAWCHQLFQFDTGTFCSACFHPEGVWPILKQGCDVCLHSYEAVSCIVCVCT